MRWLERQWHKPTLGSTLLLPLSLVYRTLVALRRYAYRRGWIRRFHVGAPVIVVGNLTVGGTGKTPLVIWLARRLVALGWTPGIVTRGYGGRSSQWPQIVTPHSDPDFIGDEPLLLARRTGVPVVADPNRVRAAQRLLQLGCDVVVSDDGLQHYRLHRDVEIAVTDGERRFGNSRLLPAGPLREPLCRLQSVDAHIVNGTGDPAEWSLRLAPARFRNTRDPRTTVPLTEFGGNTVHAVAGIGYPPRFFQTLRTLGLDVIEHAFPDHHRYRTADLNFSSQHDVIMTEKDAVKCERFADDAVWYLEVDANVDPRFDEWLQQRLEIVRSSRGK